MFEWLFATLLLVAFGVLVARRGYAHLLVRGLPWAVLAGFTLAAWMLEALPFTARPAPPTVLTAICVAIGLMSGRLASRAIVGWGRGLERDVVTGHATADARMVHPVLAAGIVVLGTPLLYTLAALRHESLEIEETPRDPATGVVLGAEDRRIPGDPAISHGALLVHGFLGSPADFGDLPDRLAARGIAVRVLRLPGHGTGPSVLDEVTPEEYDTSVAAARTELAAKCRRVSLVGFSFGGSLAVRSAAAEAPHRLVLVNPWLGRTWTPAWLPVETDALTDLAAVTTPRIMKPPGMTRCNDPAGVERARFYSTVRTRASKAAREHARAAGAADLASKLTAPTLVLVSPQDRTAPASFTQDWYASLPLPEPTKRIVTFDRSDHLLLLDHDRDAAIDEVVRFLAE